MDMDSNSDRSGSGGEGSDFHPNSEILTEAGTTPSTHLRDQLISDGTKKRVLRVDPNNGRCLIENCNPARAVEFAHCYPRSLTKESARVSSIFENADNTLLSSFRQMTSLEYWWDMRFQTLNLDTRYNIFPGASSLPSSLSKADFRFPSECLFAPHVQ
jgi:hypothetical protein